MSGAASCLGADVERAMPLFPGATLLIDGQAQILTSWLGSDAPSIAPVGDLFAALDVDDTGCDAARTQFLLASLVGSPSEAWTLLAADAPVVLMRRSGEPLMVSWSPALDGGVIAGVYAYVIARQLPCNEPDDPEERNRICVDCLSLLDECDGSLRHLTVDPGARHAVHRMFRAIHTIKGATRSRALHKVSELAHEIEDTLDALRSGELTIDIALLDQALRGLRAAVNEARPRGDVDDAMTEFSADCRVALTDLALAIERRPRGGLDPAVALAAIDRIAAAADRAKLRGLAVQCTASRNAIAMLDGGDLDDGFVDEARALVDHVELYIAVHRELAASDQAASLIATISSWSDDHQDEATQTNLIGLVGAAQIPSLAAALISGELYASRRALAAVADLAAMCEPARARDEASVRFEHAQRELVRAVDDLARTSPLLPLENLRTLVERMVWVPLSTTGRRLTRMAKSLASELGKKFTLELELGELYVAPAISRVITDILVHAVRNAADHGIESSAQREASGKPASGTIKVIAQSVDDRVYVTISDDGRGIAVDRVRAIAIERGLLDASRAVSDAEIRELLFAPGFSTATTISAVSGRGVGMDVIRTLVEELGGRVQLDSREGHGTELSLDLPLAP